MSLSQDNKLSSSQYNKTLFFEDDDIIHLRSGENKRIVQFIKLLQETSFSVAVSESSISSVRHIRQSAGQPGMTSRVMELYHI